MNGLVDSIGTVLGKLLLNTFEARSANGNDTISVCLPGAIAACCIGNVKVDFEKKSSAVIITISLVLSGLILYIYSSQSLWMMYFFYILYCTIFQTTLVIAQ